MEQLIENIKQWGIDRGIDKCDPLMQTTKTLEEIIELQQAIIRYENNYKRLKETNYGCCVANRLSEHKISIKDAIGDIFVTLAMLDLQQPNINIHEHVDDGYMRHFFNPLECSRALTKQMLNMQCAIVNFNNDEEIPLYIIETLTTMGNYYNLTLKECVEHAYNEIKDRKGKVIDGLFVKEIKKND